LRLLALLLALVLLARCGSEDGPDMAAGGPEAAWAELLARMTLQPDPGLVDVTVRGAAPELEVAVVSHAQRALAFADALYGATAYTFAAERWKRVDTAVVRAQVAPLLGPGEKATFRLPVREADSYRVLVPVTGKAAWGDSP